MPLRELYQKYICNHALDTSFLSSCIFVVKRIMNSQKEEINANDWTGGS